MTAPGGPRTAAALGLVVVTGCYTTTNVATLAPLHTAYPVSASRGYIDQSGQVVTDKDYQVVQTFSFMRIVETPRHEETATDLALEPYLDRIMSTTAGDAITSMRIQAIDYDAGSHGSSAGWKITGWVVGFTGATLVAIGAGVGNDPRMGTHDGDSLMLAGAITMATGALCYLLGHSLQAPASWQLEVSGKVVKHTGPAVQAPAPPPAASPP